MVRVEGEIPFEARQNFPLLSELYSQLVNPKPDFRENTLAITYEFYHLIGSFHRLLRKNPKPLSAPAVKLSRTEVMIWPHQFRDKDGYGSVYVKDSPGTGEAELTLYRADPKEVQVGIMISNTRAEDPLRPARPYASVIGPRAMEIKSFTGPDRSQKDLATVKLALHLPMFYWEKIKKGEPSLDTTKTDRKFWKDISTFYTNMLRY